MTSYTVDVDQYIELSEQYMNQLNERFYQMNMLFTYKDQFRVYIPLLLFDSIENTDDSRRDEKAICFGTDGLFQDQQRQHQEHLL